MSQEKNIQYYLLSQLTIMTIGNTTFDSMYCITQIQLKFALYK